MRFELADGPFAGRVVMLGEPSGTLAFTVDHWRGRYVPIDTIFDEDDWGREQVVGGTMEWKPE